MPNTRMPKPGGSALVPSAGSEVDVPAPGKRTLSEQLPPIQRSPAHQTHGPKAAAPGVHTPQVAQPEPGIDRTGFIDNTKGAPLYNRPPEAGGDLIRDAPLPPAARVFASGTYPKLRDWCYVTAFVDGVMLRGYVESHRINIRLPEPFAELRQLVGGETPEGLAKEKYGEAVRDGHDLRYYENVLLHVNKGREGIGGTYQDPNVAGGGSDNIKLYAGHRIWLVSPEYAKALEGVVPSGSLTGGAVAKAKRFGAHLQDILQSVTESRHHLDEVAGEYAQAIRDNLLEIIGITAGFLALEASSMFLASTPTGVGQAVAAVIQLALSAFGAAGMVQSSVEALKHGSAWLTKAWTAHGRPEVIYEASKEFLRMLVMIAIAALNAAGAKGNYRNALKIANNMPTGGLPALVTSGAHASGGVQAGAGVAIGPSFGSPAAVGAGAARLSDKEKAALGEGPEVDAVGERKTNEARSRERRDRRAAEGRAKPEVDSAGVELHEKARTDLAEHVPSPGDAFIDWFDSLTIDELDRLLADKSTKGKIGAAQVIADNIRHPGSQHEWLMVAEARKFKRWGVSMRTIQEGRSFTDATIGRRFRHGGTGAGRMHAELRAMIRSSDSYAEFLAKLNEWADRELVPSHSVRWPAAPPQGRYSLPDTLQLRGDGS